MEKLSLRSFWDEDLPLFQKWIYREHVAKWFEHPFAWIKELQNRILLHRVAKKTLAFANIIVTSWVGRIGTEVCRLQEPTASIT